MFRYPSSLEYTKLELQAFYNSPRICSHACINAMLITKYIYMDVCICICVYVYPTHVLPIHVQNLLLINMDTSHSEFIHQAREKKF